VIVGRGSQYFLQDRPDAYHVFVYAPLDEKIRLEQKNGKTALQARHLVETVDRERAAFIKKYFAKQWPNHSLYHLMVNSKIGDEVTVETILRAIECLNKHEEAHRE
jgi:cytidylate kinase